MNHVLQVHNFLTDNECNQIIDKYKSKTEDTEGYKHTGYQYCIMSCTDEVDWLIKSKEPHAIDLYQKAFPESKLTPHQWRVEEMVFKHWKPGKHFEMWHSENWMQHPYRIFNYQIYLSDHNCGTEFYDKSVIKSEKGKMTMFPAYFTHTHRGQQCPDKKDRYLLGGYFHFYDERLMW